MPLLTKFTNKENKFLNFMDKASFKLYLGNFFNIYDEVGVYFAEVFYAFLLKGYSYPEALFKSKLKLRDKYGEESLIWASYTIFVDSVESVLESMINNSINISEKISKINYDEKDEKSVQSQTPEIGNTDIIDENGKQLPSMGYNFSSFILPAIIIIIGIIAAVFYFSSRSEAMTRPDAKDVIHHVSVTEDVSKDTDIIYKGTKQSDIKEDDELKKLALKDSNSKDKNIDSRKRLAVLYFDNTSKNKKLAPLRKALADMLISDISGINSMNVVEREKLEDIIRELNLSKTKYIDRKSALKIGRMLSAKYIMIGSFLDPPIDGLPLRVDAKIIDVETSEIKWAGGATGKKKDLYKIKDKLVKKLKKSGFVKEFK